MKLGEAIKAAKAFLADVETGRRRWTVVELEEAIAPQYQLRDGAQDRWAGTKPGVPALAAWLVFNGEDRPSEPS